MVQLPGTDAPISAVRLAAFTGDSLAPEIGSTVDVSDTLAALSTADSSDDGTPLEASSADTLCPVTSSCIDSKGLQHMVAIMQGSAPERLSLQDIVALTKAVLQCNARALLDSMPDYTLPAVQQAPLQQVRSGRRAVTAPLLDPKFGCAAACGCLHSLRSRRCPS